MRIPLRNRQITIELERVARRIDDRPELIGASDRDIERLARSGRLSREPRWEAPVSTLGIGMRI